MQLTQTQRAIILAGVREFIKPSVHTHLFGPRLDAAKHSGDADLQQTSPSTIPLLACAELKMALNQRLPLPVEIVTYVSTAEPTRFQAIALALALEESSPMESEKAA